jgi:protein-S-isoprenylcysteine O-methyltransferase Ste14
MVYSVTAALFAVLFSVAAWHRFQAGRSGEPLDRRAEAWPLLIAIRLSGLLLLAAGIGAFRRPSPVSPLWQWAGVSLFALSVAWMVWMYSTLGRNLTDTVAVRRDAFLVTHGPYRLVRHPMYTGLLVAGLALALIQGSSAVALATLLTFTLLAIRSRTEDRFLAARFGAPYLAYARRTPPFLPRIN